MKAILLIDHGSRRDAANEMMNCMANLVQAMAGPDVVVRYAHMELCEPSIAAGVRECVEAVLPWGDRLSAKQILGSIDAQKFRSSLTLFDRAEANALFAAGLAAFFAGEPDERTLALLNARL